MTTTWNTEIEPVELAGVVPGELHAVLLNAGLSERQSHALALRLGFDGAGTRTLAEAGDAVGYTRERVRQLEQRVREHACRMPPPLPVTTCAVEMLARSTPASKESAAHVLAANGLVSPRFDLAGILATADLFGIEHDLELLGAAVLRGRDAELVPHALADARRLQRRDGVASLARVLRELHDAESRERLRRLLDLQQDVVWLDDACSWFVVRGVRSRVASILRKMMTVTDTLTLGEVDHGMRRAFRPVNVPSNVVAPLCERHPWLVVDRRRQIVTRKVTFDARRELTPVERGLADLFSRQGPVLSFAEAVELGSRAGLNRPTIGVYLTRSPIFERVHRGRYVLRGTPRTAAPS